MIFDRLSTLLAWFGMTSPARAAAAESAEIWRRAARAVPEILPDLIRQGGVLTGQPVENQNGWPQLAPVDPYRLAYEAGRRDMALQLLAAAGLTQTQANELIKEQDYG